MKYLVFMFSAFLTGCLPTNVGGFKKFYQRMMAGADVRAELIECQPHLAKYSRAGYCVFRIDQKSIRKLAEHYALGNASGQPRSMIEDIHLKTTPALKPPSAPTFAPVADMGCESVPQLTFTEPTGWGKHSGETEWSMQYRTLLLPEVEMYLRSGTVIDAELGESPRFNRLFFSPKTGTGCLEVHYPYG